MRALLKEKAEIEAILLNALSNKGFKMLYQPIVEVQNRRVSSFEALIRLKDSDMSPAKFIPVAEESGLIVEIGRLAAQMVIEQLGVWRTLGVSVPQVSVNFSGLQLYDLDFVAFLEWTLQKNDVPAELLEIEITENIFMDNRKATLEFLGKLRDMGVKIAIDDFGTGYSSINYLSYLPVDRVKLDRSLCERFLDIENIRVMDSIIMLAHGLKLEVVAEGIESPEQVKRLQVGNCDYIQGYYFSKPLEKEEALNVIGKIYN